eukprot:3201826-Heterocapsa_arctica.AAC.1
MPVGTALRWCGWDVVGYDKEWATGKDLHDPGTVEELNADISKASAVVMAMDCSTLSRARERPIPGCANPPRPLRDAAHLHGLPTLTPRESQRVQDTDNLVDMCGRIA